MTTQPQPTPSAPEDDDVITVLLAQHQRIRSLFSELLDGDAAHGQHRSQVFDELRALLAVHETAEELVLRPVSADVAGKDVAQARDDEEAEANKVLAELEKLDVDSPAFAQKLATFHQAVDKHATAEETQEFPAIRAKVDADKRQAMGKRLKAAEAIAPTHPHPGMPDNKAAKWAVGPIAGLVDRVRDAVGGTNS